MENLTGLTFDSVVTSAIACLVLREVFLLTLPDTIAGPGGWLINTDPE